jgi:hypothetical protein
MGNGPGSFNLNRRTISNDSPRRDLKKAIPDLIPQSKLEGREQAIVSGPTVPALTGQQTNEGATKNPVQAIGEQHDVDPS